MFDTVIGLEIHVQLKTESKMFCSCSNKGEHNPPNTTVCSICLGHPGTLPVINEQAVTHGARMSLALNCTVNKHSKFDRKNYFYPDLPKGYQISQYDEPLGIGGHFDIQVPAPEGQRKEVRVRMNRLHLEEDAAKLTHATGGSLVDFNRAGTPLAEIVTEPDLASPLEAKTFLHELRLLARYLDISEADMEKGHLRCDANVSIKFEQNGVMVASPISEIKNLNSFKAVEQALEYESHRLYQDYLAGGETSKRKNKITVGWDEKAGKTILQRGKEEAHDYRYFPEPDLPPLHFTQEAIDVLHASLPELPIAKRLRFIEEYGLKPEEAHVLVEDKATASFFEEACSEFAEQLQDSKTPVSYKLVSSWLINKLPALLNAQGIEPSESNISPERFAEFIVVVANGTVNSTSAQTLLEAMLNVDKKPADIIAEMGLEQVNDEGILKTVAEKVIADNAKAVADYKGGNTNVIMFLVGQVMKEMKGKAQPEMARTMLEGLLK